MKKKIKQIPLKCIKWILIFGLIAVVLYPLLWLLISAFKTENDILVFPPEFLADSYTLQSFKKIFETIPMHIYLKNTVIFAVGSSILALLFDSMAGYAFARMRFKGKNILFALVLATMMVPFQVIMIPLFLESWYLGLLNTYPGLILPKASTAFGIFMMRSFFTGLPKDLEEAARVDGMNEAGIFFKIMLPLAIPGMMTLGILHLMNNWNDLLYPLMMTNATNMRTLTAGLAMFVGERAATYYGPQIAGAVISIAPLVILYAFFQKYFVNSIAATGMKD